MRSIFSNLFYLFFFTGLTSFAFSQDNTENGVYNLPPGYHINPAQPVFDLSYRLNDEDSKPFPESKLQVLKNISEEELIEMPQEYRDYVSRGEVYINSLSEYVRSVYSKTELWYIYAFDQNLKNKLLQL